MRDKIRFAINIVENTNHDILLLKRHPQAGLGAGLWGFPAGHIESGETAVQAALRELIEEIGPDFHIETIRYLSPLPGSLHGGDAEIHLFHQRWLGGEVKLNAEHTAFAWVGKERFRDYQVMDGVDEDLLYLHIWPRSYLNELKLPPLQD